MDQRDRLMARMADMQASLDRLNDKIQRYEQGLMSQERLLQRLHTERQM